MDWKTSDFDYELPESLIAFHPPEARDGGRLLVLPSIREYIHENPQNWETDEENPNRIGAGRQKMQRSLKPAADLGIMSPMNKLGLAFTKG